MMSFRPKKKNLLALALTAAVLGTGSSGFIGSAEARPEKGGRHERLQEKLKELNLSGEQQKKVDEIRKQGRAEAKKLRQNLKAARTQLKEAVQKDSSKEELTKLFQTVQEKQQAMSSHLFGQAMAIREVLNPEQRKKAGEMMSKFFDRWKKGGPGIDDGNEE